MNKKIDIVRVEKKQGEKSPLLDQEKKSDVNEVEQIVITKSSFWDRFLLKLSVEEKATITENIIEEIGNKPLYWVQLVVSVIISCLGLLQNSVAIIIGGMLIAPLLKPIKGLAFAITTGQPNYFWRAAKMLIMSILVAICAAYLVSLAVPLKIETYEILARVSPNALDLLIAVAAGVIAILSLYFKKLSENLAGVAMAAAILPPLAVTGIELALKNSNAVFGSFFLFVTNLFAILAVGVIIFLLYGFFPAHQDFKQRAVRIGAILFMLLVFISFPLNSSLNNIAERIDIKARSFEVFEESLKRAFSGVELVSINVDYFDDESIDLSGKLKVPEYVRFVAEDHKMVRDQLADEFGRNVSMEFEVIPIVNINED